MSPLEQMIDKACGYVAPRIESDDLVLVCRVCKRAATIRRPLYGMEGVRRLETVCPDCEKSPEMMHPIPKDAPDP